MFAGRKRAAPAFVSGAPTNHWYSFYLFANVESVMHFQLVLGGSRFQKRSLDRNMWKQGWRGCSAERRHWMRRGRCTLLGRWFILAAACA